MELPRPRRPTNFSESSATEAGSYGIIRKISIAWKRGKDFALISRVGRAIARALGLRDNVSPDLDLSTPIPLTTEESRSCYFTALSEASDAESAPSYAAGSWRVAKQLLSPDPPQIAPRVWSTALSGVAEVDEN